jgi:hypothetical protein
MWKYEKRLQYPVNISQPNPKMAQFIISQYGGPDGEMGASMRYLSQRFSMPYKMAKGTLTDIGISVAIRSLSAPGSGRLVLSLTPILIVAHIILGGSFHFHTENRNPAARIQPLRLTAILLIFPKMLSACLSKIKNRTLQRFS